MDALRKRHPMSLKGAIVRLNPFIDESGVLRVGGRLRNASLPYSTRHPMLLPKKAHLVELLVQDRHIKNSHAGCNALMAILQREFWILSGRRTVRGIQRLKWTDRTDPPSVGDLVLVKDANLPPLRWRRGRIVSLFPGKDGTPRFAEVMVGDSVLKRA
ncbi:Uncharacterized protein OBRU01_22050, partial [Operophtera brumata]